MSQPLALLKKLPAKCALVFASLTLIATVPALAQNTLSEGAFVMIGKSYDSTTNRFSNDVPEGERTVCFQITKITETEMELRHISGTYQPAWSSTETFAPGTYHDTWFSSTSYLQNNPGANPLGELIEIFKPVATCP